MPQSSSEAGGLVTQTPGNGTLANNGYHGSIALPPEVPSPKRRPLWSGIFIPIVVAVVCGLGAFVVSNYFMTRWYTTSTTIWFPASGNQGSAGILNSLIGGGAADATGNIPILGGIYSSPQFGAGVTTAMTALDSGRVKSAVMTRLNLAARWHLPPDKAAERFNKRVIFGVDKDGLLSVSATDTSGRLAQQIVNTYVDEMRSVSVDLSTSIARKNLVAVRRRYADAQADLLRQEGELVALQKRTANAMPLGSSVTSSYADLINQQAATRTALSETNAEIQAQLQTAQKTYGQSTQLPENVPFAQSTVQNLRKAESDFNHIKSVYGPDYPGYREAQDRLNQARAEADAELHRQITAASKLISPELAPLYVRQKSEMAEFSTLEQEAATRKADMISLPAAQMREDDLQRSISLSNQVDTTLAQAVTQAELAENRDAPTFETIDPAGMPVDPSEPRVFYITALATVAGLLLALAWQTARILLRQPATQEALQRYADAYGLSEDRAALPATESAGQSLIGQEAPSLPHTERLDNQMPSHAAGLPAAEDRELGDHLEH